MYNTARIMMNPSVQLHLPDQCTQGASGYQHSKLYRNSEPKEGGFLTSQFMFC